MQTILLATDGSACARGATIEAIELARATGWPLHVVTVWNIPAEAGLGPPTIVPEIMDVQREHALRVAGDTVAEAAEAGVTATSEVRNGSAAEEICAAAQELPAGIVVIGAHGWGPVKRVLVGSVSTQVLHEAPCPVLVVRADRPAGEAAGRPGATAGAPMS